MLCLFPQRNIHSSSEILGLLEFLISSKMGFWLQTPVTAFPFEDRLFGLDI